MIAVRFITIRTTKIEQRPETRFIIPG